jgi:DNA-binding response OmpR family regulator
MRANTPTGTDSGAATDATILMVEDDPAIADALGALLRDAGYAVEHEPAGRPALARLLERPPDLLLLDLRLPDLDGMEVCRLARRRAQGLPIVMLTARGETRNLVAGLDGGADDYIVKPVDREVLLARIDAVLRGRRAARGNA